ncbi:MAG: DNRLRE domain-containing protein [Planctomycetota bacterium]
MKKTRNSILISLGLLLILLQPVSGTEVVQIQAGRDNTLFESATGTLSNGIGPFLFTGLSAGLEPPQIKRGLIWFDVTGNIPPGSTITSVTLKLSLSRTRDLSSRIVELHRVLQDWGEGTSNSGTIRPGGGAAATTGDATWLHTFFNTVFWANAGGDFSGTVSGSQSVGILAGDFTWGSTAQMVADVQSWLDDPNNNFGWSILTDESVLQTARRFGSRENATVANRPLLTIEYILIADLDDSGFINFDDHALFANEWQATDCTALNDWCNRADMAPVGSPDGKVDYIDLREFVLHWLQ